MFKITKPVRLIELFSGVGAQAMAMRDLGVNFEYWKTSDWDVSAVRSYKAIHHGNDNTDYSEGMTKEDLVKALLELCISSDGKAPMTEQQIGRKNEKWLRETYNSFKASHNLGSITGIHAEDLELKDSNDTYTPIMFYSFPCTDISVSGQQKGFSKGSGTRSGLLWEVERILWECKELNCLPEILIMENVVAIHNKKNLPDFEQWLQVLDEIGYHTYYKDMNAKHYGIAQNRDRCFAVSLLSDEPYVFPEPIPLTRRLKDYLEDNVDEKYYIQNEKTDKLIQSLIDRGVLPAERERAIDLSINEPRAREIANCISARTDRGISNHRAEGNGVVSELCD